MKRLDDCKQGGLWAKPDKGGDLHLDSFEVIIEDIDDYQIDTNLKHQKIVVLPCESFKFDFALSASTGQKVGNVVLAGTSSEVNAILARLKTDNLLITREVRPNGEIEYDYWSQEIEE